MDRWTDDLWRQFGAAIDTLDDALLACPDALWHKRLWIVPSEPPFPDGFAQFWYVGYHTLFWLDLHLFGSGEGFAPPPPFDLSELDAAGAVPERPYTKQELRDYLTQLRHRCQTTLTSLTDAEAGRHCTFPWGKGQPVSYFELQLYSMRHVQEHAAQLHLFLGQHASGGDSSWVARARGEPAGA